MSEMHSPSQGSPGSGSPRRLTRSRTDRKLAGVCGGFAAYAGVDSNLIRLLMVVLTLFGGAGPVLYVVAWIILPEDAV